MKRLPSADAPILRDGVDDRAAATMRTPLNANQWPVWVD
jgi:hypothetical protein